ncbi:hypothetical protein [Symbiopectobacterium purcellii]|uniref:hypothetical protein n=1 Tax=Symbiopectobacterium purcellii TaxID=2871826 RepID=UPI003F83DBED
MPLTGICLRCVIANRLKNDYILCPDMRQRSIAGCYQNNVAWLYEQMAEKKVS